MKDINIKHSIIGLIWITISTLHANAKKDSLSLNPNWNTLFPSQLSDNGEWLIYYQNYINAPEQNKVFVIGTNNRKTTELTGLKDFVFFEDHMLIGKSDTDISVYNLQTSKIIDQYSNVQSFGVLDKLNAICYLADNQQLNIIQYKKHKPEKIISDNDVTQYQLSPDKKQLLYLKENQGTELYAIDLTTLKARKLTNLKENPIQIIWNNENNVCAIIKDDNTISIFDLNNNKIKNIELPIKDKQELRISVEFFLNNDLYISYNLKQQPQKEDEFVDIWNGNARDLHVMNKRNLTPKAYIYQYSQEKLVELNRTANREFLNIKIPNYIISYNPFEFVSYLVSYDNKRFELEQIEPRKKITELSISYNFPTSYVISPNNEYIVYPKEDFWELYNFKSSKKQIILHTNPFNTPVWSQDSNYLYLQSKNNLIKYNINTNKYHYLTVFKDDVKISIVNTKYDLGKGVNEFDDNTPLLFYITNNQHQTSLYSYFKGKTTKIINQSPKKINTRYLRLLHSKDAKTIVWTESDFNQPPVIKIAHKGKVEKLVESSLPKQYYQWRKQKIITYQDKYGIELTGILYYPKNYTKEKKYPMITSVYQRQGASRNIFDVPTLFNQHGYNQSLLNELGYFVFLPDTYVSEEGPGLSALECVTKGIEAITKEEPAIDKTKLGLIGHSFGGYQTNFIATQTDIFSAIVSGAGLADLVWNAYEYNYHLSKPNYSRLETIQYELESSYAENPDRYLKNSSILYAQNINTPLLLWTGMKDDNVHWENTRHMFIALKRYKIPTIALFYKNIRHAISSSNRKEQKDLTIRTIDWFNFYLKDNKDTQWIKKGINYQY